MSENNFPVSEGIKDTTQDQSSEASENRSTTINQTTQDDPGQNSKVANGKNSYVLFCIHCPSKIMEKSVASYCQQDKELPKMSQKKNVASVEMEIISEWFCVQDIMQFENIGVSHAVQDVKYLACADCEMGPVGWTDAANRKCYIALSRVRHS